MLTKSSSIPVGLPKKVTSICPECGKLIDGQIVNEKGMAVMKKNCSEHGDFSEVVWSDAEMFLRMEKWARDGVGVENPAIPEAKECPFDCGLCNLHLSHTALANVDLTNRCNMKCPICFANANAAGYVFEPDFDTIVDMLRLLREERPVPTPAVQFSGGEPTIHPEFVKVIRKASEMGFAQVQVATNGIRFANEPDFLRAASEAGLNTIYLQFDGMREEIYIAARGRPLLEVKNKVIENLRKLDPHPSAVLVPTLVKGINDDQVWPIVQFALQNMDVIRGVNFQPVAFSGRISQEERSSQRYTLSDIAIDIERQSKNAISKDDWYPVPSVTAISDLVGVIVGKKFVTFTTHPHCGIATYVFIDNKTKEITPITRFVDVDNLFKEMRELAEWSEERSGKLMTKMKALKLLRKYIHKEGMPRGMSRTKFLKMLTAVFSDESKKALASFSWNMLFIGGMHFQDAYNYDVDRVMRCCIHYTTPDGRIIPFCAYNSGPVYREEIEKKFSVSLEQWRREKGDEFT
ncbi:MAG TPA: radical SAM protein [Euryarchaeota archaeon]|nr:radical SAM protein [Euryarchaeota archaeon]